MPTAPIEAEQPQVHGSCIYCGNSSPRDAYVHCYASTGQVRRLWCSDAAACEARQAEQAHLALGYVITDAGRQALATIERAEQLALLAAS
jgi:hypothetical protein